MAVPTEICDIDKRYHHLKDSGNDKFKLRQFGAAKELYTEAILLKKAEPIPYLNRAACNIQLKLYYDVIKDCDLALKLDPELSKGYYRRATSLNELSRLNLARADYIKASELDPGNESIKSELAKIDSVFKQNGRIDVKCQPKPDYLKSKKALQTFKFNNQYSGTRKYNLED